MVSGDAGRQRLWVLGGKAPYADEWPSRGVISIGRSTHNMIVLDHPSISRKHALLEVGPPLMVRDAGSHNGVRVRGKQLAASNAAEVAVGEAFDLGGLTLVVQRIGHEYDDSGPTSPSLPPPPPAEVNDPIVIADPAMRRIFELVDRVATSPISVLVLGETGVGKEVIAEAIHRRSPRSARPLVKLNCGALTTTLLESELFGHERGAFPDAHRTKPGLFETADHGTVFLDEVGELPPETQVKLLRVLEDRRVQRVGGLAPRTVNVRFIAATNRDLAAEAESGRFRRDLYYRINGVTITVPALRERPADIRDLAVRFAELSARAAGLGGAPVISEPVFHALHGYAWPGNVRELRNVIERAVLLSGGSAIGVQHLAPDVTAAGHARPSMVRHEPTAEGGSAMDRRETLQREIREIDRKRIVEALERCAGNQTRAAELLGMPRRTLVAKLREYDIPRPRKAWVGVVPMRVG